LHLAAGYRPCKKGTTMSSVFRKQYTIAIPADAERITHNGEPCVRFRDSTGKNVVRPLTKNGDRVRVYSPNWYGSVNGEHVALCENKKAAETMLAEKRRNAKLDSIGMGNPFAAQQSRPLAEHLAEYKTALESEYNTARYVAMVISRLDDLLTGCKFVFIRDLSASRAMEWLKDLRNRTKPRVELPEGKELFKRREVAAVLGIKPASVNKLVARWRLAAQGTGKARRFPRATLVALQARNCQGASVETSNQYLRHLKAFGAWLVADKRTGENTVAHLQPGNFDVDRRHDRRELDAAELRRLLTAARDSTRSFRELTGRDRYHLYALVSALPAWAA
jgi:hypothetical protein